MYHHRQIWREVSRIVREHGDMPDSAYWEYHRDIYAATQAVAVRRQAEHRDRRVASLGRLISEVRGDAEQLTPAWWVGLWTFDEREDFARLDQARAQRAWEDQYGGNVGDHLDPDIPGADLDRLTAAAASVKAWVDKHVAHSEDPGAEPEDPGASAAETSLTLEDIHDAIDVIGELFQRYYSLMTASSMVFLEPVIQHDWLAPFRVPWIRADGARRSGEA